MKTKAELNAMTLSQLASYYNGLHFGKAIKKFPSKDKAVARILKVQKQLEDGQGKAVDAAAAAANNKVAAKRKTAAKKRVVKKPTKPAADKSDLPRASTVYVKKTGKKGWKDYREYRSVLVAFQELNLPVGIHQGFRKELKLVGEQVIGDFHFESRDFHHGLSNDS